MRRAGSRTPATSYRINLYEHRCETQKGSYGKRLVGEEYPVKQVLTGAKLNKIYDVLARVPLFKDTRREDIGIEPLNSFTNLNYKVAVNANIYVLRIAGKGTSTYIDRTAEEYNARIATAAGLNANVLFFDANDGTMCPGLSRVLIWTRSSSNATPRLPPGLR
jgi:hypothetical protein